MNDFPQSIFGLQVVMKSVDQARNNQAQFYPESPGSERLSDADD